ncbi:MAG: DNA alkylation repair protein [Chloroflexota bacterium]
MTEATAVRPSSGPTESTGARSETTTRVVALVAERKPRAEALGQGLADLVTDPDAFAAALSEGFAELADPEYLDGQRRVAPGIGRLFGVRWPLVAAVERGLRAATHRSSTAGVLEVAARLFAVPELEARWFAFALLDRLLVDDPERTWQLLRRASREAGDWITVDSLAHPAGRGIILEPYRWAELDSLVFSPSRWERRLVGSTVATLPSIDHRRGRTTDVARHGLALVDELIGDDQPDVQKALAWALRSMTLVDSPATLAFIERQAKIAAANDDGHRAWVLRDTLTKLPPQAAAGIRNRLDGIRRRSGAPATSRAALTSARFSGEAGLPPPSSHRDRFADSATRSGDARP